MTSGRSGRYKTPPEEIPPFWADAFTYALCNVINRIQKWQPIVIRAYKLILSLVLCKKYFEL